MNIMGILELWIYILKILERSLEILEIILK